MPPTADPPGGRAAERSEAPLETRAVILVEGLSDAAAVEVLARRRGNDLGRAGVVVQAMGGATNIAAHLEHFGPQGIDVRLAGLYDAAEERFFVRGLERAGVATGLTPGDLAGHGFLALDPDLEDELIQALGPDRCAEVIRAEGDLVGWELFRQQPFQRERPATAQLHRWLGSGSGRKIRYAAAFVDALDLEAVPPALHAVLDRALT